jgi:hypothetical protein
MTERTGWSLWLAVRLRLVPGDSPRRPIPDQMGIWIGMSNEEMYRAEHGRMDTSFLFVFASGMWVDAPSWVGSPWMRGPCGGRNGESLERSFVELITS